MIALSSAYKQALVAVDINGKQAFKMLDANCKHSENLLPALDMALDEVDEKLSNNDVYAVVVGPGSFTGLRITAALIKGILAGDERKNVLTITTFALMAYSYIKNFKPKDDFLCIINALSGYYFICQFDADGNQIGTEQIVIKEEVDKINLQKVSLAEENIEGEKVQPTAEELLSFVQEKVKEASLISAAEILPIYLRKSQAEDALEEKSKK